MKSAFRLQFKLLVLAGLSTVTMACQQSEYDVGSELSASAIGDSQKIFGGDEIKNSADFLFTSTVSIENKFGESNDCTGSLIHKRVVLTAAHCVSADTFFRIDTKIRFFAFHSRGTDTGKANGIVRRVKSVSIAPKYAELEKADPADRRRLYYDVALILLDEDAPAGTNILPVVDRELKTDWMKSFWTVGFGASGGQIDTDADTGIKTITPTGAGPLRRVELNRSESPETPHWFQSKQSARGICYGDSGSPALVMIKNRWVQIGVATFVKSTDTEACRKEGYFVNLSYRPADSKTGWAEWIAAQTDALARGIPAR